MEGCFSYFSSMHHKVFIFFLSTNRIEYLIPTLNSFREKFITEGVETYKVLIDDFPEGRDNHLFYKIKDDYDIDHLILNRKNLGLSKSLRKIWDFCPKDCDYIWHQEDDFVFNDKISLKNLINKFEKNKDILFQITLKRQVWYEDNDIIEKIKTGKIGIEHDGLILNKEYFNFNPSLYPSSVTYEDFDHDPHESLLINSLIKKYPNKFSSFLGERESQHVTHIGDYTQGVKNFPEEPGYDSYYSSDLKYYSRFFRKEYIK